MKEIKPIHLILVRHGNTFEAGETPTQVGARTDLPLTAAGRKQAEDIARYISSRKTMPSAIYAGTLKRQIETAHLIGKTLGIEDRIHIDTPGLTEIDYGLWEGLTADEIASRWPVEYADWTEQSRWAKGIFGGDTVELIKGIQEWLDGLKRSHRPGDTVVGVTSNGILRFFYALNPLEWERLAKERKMETIKVKTGHLCELDLFHDRVHVKSWNKNPLIMT